jgi:PhnB protein
MQQPTNSYLTIRGATEAIAFYQKAFGAQEIHRLPAQDGKRVMHAELSINGGTVMLSDEFPEHTEHGAVNAPTEGNPPSVATCIHFAKPAELDAMFKRAIGAGGKSTMDPADMFWNARFAMLTDPFGHRWMFNAPLPPK